MLSTLLNNASGTLSLIVELASLIYTINDLRLNDVHVTYYRVSDKQKQGTNDSLSQVLLLVDTYRAGIARMPALIA